VEPSRLSAGWLPSNRVRASRGTRIRWPAVHRHVRLQAGAAPGQTHWPGAASTAAMSYIAIQESLNGRNVDLLEKVTDEEYNG
jgi:hypothetical protein